MYSVKTRTRFSSLTWGLNNSSLTSGLLVGGMADGVVSIWDANSLLEGKYIYLRYIYAVR